MRSLFMFFASEIPQCSCSHSVPVAVRNTRSLTRCLHLGTVPARRRSTVGAASEVREFSTVQGSPFNGEQKEWSERLLDVAKPRRKQRRERDKDFTGEQLSWGESQPQEEVGTSGVLEKRLPAEIRCFDTARIYIKSGDGGTGCVAFRREKFVEFGGPAGGSGGRGGHVWAIADTALNSLFPFRKQVHYRADGGQPGQGKNMDGAQADDLYIKVPPGTIIRKRDAEEGEPPLAELIRPGEKALLAVGGRGGRGNYSFKTQKNPAPTIAEKGEKGQELCVDLELKVVADVGIVGVPNAGKSTLLSVVTAARPKVANYPFTTLVPNLGVCEMDYQTTVFADIPGLLEGAHEGLGLGHAFLRHIQRCRVLVHVVDGTSPDPIGDYKAINLELELFNPALKDKPQIVAYNKVDQEESGDYWDMVREYLIQEEGVHPENICAISALTGRGVLQVVRQTRAVLEQLGPQELTYETDAMNVTEVPRARSLVRLDDYVIDVEEEAGQKYFIIQGEAMERFSQMTNWDYYEAVKRFHRALEVTGVTAGLRAKGVAEGDTVVLGDVEFVWSDDQSEGAMFSAWKDDMRARGRQLRGVSRWPKPRMETKSRRRGTEVEIST